MYVKNKYNIQHNFKPQSDVNIFAMIGTNVVKCNKKYRIIIKDIMEVGNKHT